MNWKYLLLSVLIFASCGKQPDVPAKHAERIVIKYVNFYITSFIRVECNVFDKSFDDIKKEIEITKPEEVKALVEETTKLKDDPKVTLPDVRCKIEIYYDNGDMDEICMSFMRVSVNGKPKIITDEFKAAVMKYTGDK